MDYYKMNKDELIQEIIKLRKNLELFQGNEFIKTVNIKQGKIIESSLQENQSELFIRISPDYKYNYVNQAYTYFLKRECYNFVGQNIFDSLPDFKDDAIDFLNYLNVDNPEASVEYMWANAEGKTNWRRWTVRAIFDENQSLVEYQALGRDITEQKAPQQRLIIG